MTSRTVLFNSTGNKSNFPNNKICTTKYNILTFLPLFIYDQFSKPSNLYFLIIGSLQQIEKLSPTGRWGTALPLALSLIVSAGKEIFEDHVRDKEDQSINLRKVLVVDDFKEGIKTDSVVLQSLQVGQIVRVLRDELIPADLVLLKSSETDGFCYIETSAIDGESNLKLRQAIVQTHLMENWKDASITCDQPNNEIYNFQGSLKLPDSQDFPLDSNQFLPRGTFLVNTDWVIGVIVYTGTETKIMQNVKGNSRRKVTKMDKLNDLQNAQIVAVLIILVACLYLGHIYFHQTYLKDHFYLGTSVYSKVTNELLWEYFSNFIAFLILLNNLVPISLSVTLEIVRAILAHLINKDLDMYDDETQIPSRTHSSNVLDELGRIEYIMTDKTGTLTRNQMKLKSLLVQDHVYEDCLDLISPLMTKSLNYDTHHLIQMMALCHTVMIDKRNGTFQASSPDELALLKAAKQLGTRFVSRTSDKIELILEDDTDDDDVEYKKSFSIKAVIGFTSDRKRMSVFLQDDQTGKYFLVSKGAESTIFPLCSNSIERADVAVKEFSLQGLRTLCFAYRELEAHEASDWISQWNEAMSTFGPDRQIALDAASSKIESNLTLIGVSGIEDRLQVGVPQTISTLLRANIKIWILTGDRAETATNTAYLCGLIKPHHSIVNVNQIEDLNEEMPSEFVLTISGEVFASILASPPIKTHFANLVQHARALIAYRLSPLQKSEITQFVQVYLKKTTLAIGDGGNDVGMIQAADVGVGITGLEGTQAARSSDFSLPNFRFLAKLLLVHGAWSFHRISRVILYMMYKNFLLVLVQFWYAWLNSFSAQTAISGSLLMLYNSLFSAVSPVIIGLTDQYVTAPELLKHPQLYQFGQKGKFYNNKAFWECVVNAAVQSLTMCLCYYFLLHNGPVITRSGHPANYQISGDILFFIVLVTISIKVLLFTNFFTRIMSAALLASLIACFCTIWKRNNLHSILNTTYITAIILIPVITLLRDFIWKFYMRQFKPRAYHIVQEMRAVEIKRNKKLKQSMSKSSSVTETTPLYK